MAIPVPVGRVAVHFVYYETPRELFQILSQLETKHEFDPLQPGELIVLAVPDRVRRLMGWSTRGTPRPEIHTDVLAFQPPK